jgi:hypothetical protein
MGFMACDGFLQLRYGFYSNRAQRIGIDII